MKLFILLLVFNQNFFQTTFAASKNKIENEGDRVITLNRLIETSKSRHAETNRDMQVTWNKFRDDKDEFESVFEDKICTDPDNLRERHEELDKKVKEVELGWNLKQQQLQDLTDILNHENYTSTGLSTGNDGVGHVCEGLKKYIDEVNSTAWNEEKPELDTHKEEVVNIKTRIETHPCPCEWTSWTEWSDCTTTCERGLRYSERWIEKDAINNGTECEGPSSTEEVCNANVCCPVDCVWGQWEAWPACPGGCPGQKKTRTRQREVLADCNGRDCEGSDYMHASCSLERELQDRVNELAADLQECSGIDPNQPPPTTMATFTTGSPAVTTPAPSSCLSQCGNKPGRCPQCGVNGYCCKYGEAYEGCRGSDGGTFLHSCVTLHHEAPNYNELSVEVSSGINTKYVTGNAVSGIYKETGSLHNGEPVYEGPNDWKIFSFDDGKWCFSQSIQDNFKHWKDCSLYNIDAAPCPAEAKKWYYAGEYDDYGDDYYDDAILWHNAKGSVAIDGSCTSD